MASFLEAARRAHDLTKVQKIRGLSQLKPPRDGIRVAFALPVERNATSPLFSGFISMGSYIVVGLPSAGTFSRHGPKLRG